MEVKLVDPGTGRASASAFASPKQAKPSWFVKETYYCVSWKRGRVKGRWCVSAVCEYEVLREDARLCDELKRVLGVDSRMVTALWAHKVLGSRGRRAFPLFLAFTRLMSYLALREGVKHQVNLCHHPGHTQFFFYVPVRNESINLEYVKRGLKAMGEAGGEGYPLGMAVLGPGFKEWSCLIWRMKEAKRKWRG